MIPSHTMDAKIPILCVIGPTASGKTARAISEAKSHGGEIISVDSRQVYRMLDIGTEKVTHEEQCGIPHHLIDIRDAKDNYSAGDFVTDATQLIEEIHTRGKVPILAGGTHFYFDALFHGLPKSTPINPLLRLQLDALSCEELHSRILESDPRRGNMLDPKNKRRLIRALEIIDALGAVPKRNVHENTLYTPKWIELDTPQEELRERIDTRLKSAFDRGLVEEVRKVRAYVGDERLNELGLEYRIIGEFLRGEREEEGLLSVLSAKLWHYARHQKAWLKKLLNNESSL